MPAQVIADKLSTGLLPRQDASKIFAGHGTDTPCAGCGVTIRATDVEYELLFADERSFLFHSTCAELWRTLKEVSAGGEWRVTCSCRERIGYAATLAEAEALELEHIAVRKNSTRPRHVITIARK